MNMKMEGIEEPEDIETEKLKAELNRIVEVGTALENVQDLESAIKILENNSDIEGAEEYLAPIYIFQQHPTLENAKMVPDPCGYAIFDVLKRFVTEDALDEEGFEPMIKEGKKSSAKLASKKKKGKKSMEEFNTEDTVVEEVAQPVDETPLEKETEVIAVKEEVEAPKTESIPKNKGERKSTNEQKSFQHSKPRPDLKYDEFVNERANLMKERGGEEMNAELAKWADDALKADKENKKKAPKIEKKAEVKKEKLEGDFMYMKQSEIKDLLERAFDDVFFNRIRGTLGELVRIFEIRVEVATRFKGVENIIESELSPEEKKAFNLSKTQAQFVADIIDRYEKEPEPRFKKVFGAVNNFFKKFLGK